jgi:peptidoglycan/xylan/chitin deacetylase (PgdA/CDA1 family)
MRLRNKRPIISFTFDDFPRTALLEGGRILEEAGARGTFYTALGLAGFSNRLGQHFQMEDLHHLTERGHELGSHTFDHLSAREVSTTKFLLNVQKGHEALEELPHLIPSASFAYPFGCTNLRLKSKVGAMMQSCRGNFAGLNGPTIDRNLLNANALYGGREALGAALQLVEQNRRTNGWLIFYTHDVRPSPSSFGCTPELLEGLMKSIAKQESKIMKVSEVIDKQGLTD